MVLYPRASALLATSLLAALSVTALPKVTRTGRYLYQEDGTRFFIKGIAYQAQGQVTQSEDNPFGEPDTFVDSLANPAGCRRDIPHLQELGVNAIRVYSVDSSLDHSDCMQALDAAGIYTIIDLSLPLNGSIDRVSPSWSTNVLDLYTRTIDTFSNYDNVLAYNVGNEVVLESNTQVAPYIKAAARDIRAYLASKDSSALIGYAAIDGNENWKVALSNFLSCDPSGEGSDSTSIDLYGLNSYNWCGDAPSTTYDRTNSLFAGLNVAAYFSEYGCVKEPPRLWTETDVLFASPMTNIWSGGIAFSYFPAESADGQFGMVTVSEDESSVELSEDFERLKQHYTALSPPNEPAQSSAGASTFGPCPSTNTTWLASTDLPPTPNEEACNCLERTLSCRFTPQIEDFSATLGELVDTTCNLLGSRDLNCNEIGGNGQTGTYGRLSGCDPTIKLSYVMSEYYEAESRNAQACDFAGNATINTSAPSSVSDANAAASSCIANPGAVFTPPPAEGENHGNGASQPPQPGNGGSGSDDGEGAAVSRNAFVGMSVVISAAIGSAVWTLL